MNNCLKIEQVILKVFKRHFSNYFGSVVLIFIGQNHNIANTCVKFNFHEFQWIFDPFLTSF